MERDLLSTATVWIRFPSLHLKFWSNTIISTLTSLIGTPMFMDKATAIGERLSYARCFIEIDALKKLPKTVTLEIEEGETIDVPVEFEWIPPICRKCCSFGHQENQCRAIQTWLPKDRNPEVNEPADFSKVQNINPNSSESESSLNISACGVSIGDGIGVANAFGTGTGIEDGTGADFRAGNVANSMNTNEFGIGVGSGVVNTEGVLKITSLMLIAKVRLLLITMEGLLLQLVRLLMMVLLPRSPHQFVL